MNDRVIGILLSQQDYRENAVLLSVLTKEYGLIRFVAQGARKMTSKNAGRILPYTVAELSFDHKEGKTIFRLKSATCICLHRYIHENLEAQSASALLCDLTSSILAENGQDESVVHLYEQLETALRLLNEKRSPLIVTSLFVADVLKEIGIAPEVDQCVRCNKSNAAALSVEEGGFLCSTCCAEMHIRPMDVDLLREFRLTLHARYEDLDALMPYCCKPKTVLFLLMQFLERHGGFRLRSYAFFERLFGIEGTL